MSERKQRDSNIELFRIVTMLLIVAHHYVVNSGLTIPMGEHPWSGATLFYLIFGAWGKTGINCFVLITGFYMCQSHLTPRRYLKLLLEVYFYRIVLFLVFLLTGRVSLTASVAIHLLLPFSDITTGFTSCFLAFYLLIPFLNLVVQHTAKRQHACLILLLLNVYMILPRIPTVEGTFNYLSWFIVCYFIGAYLRLYSPRLVSERPGWKLLVSVLLSVCSIVAITYWISKTGRDLSIAYYFLEDSNKPFALLVAVLAFSFFRSLSFGFHKWINTIASAAFGVLLIHANGFAMRTLLWNDLLHNQESYGKPGFIAHAVLSVIVVYIVCTILDLMRIRWIERPVFAFYDRIEPRLIRHVKRLFNKIIPQTEEGGAPK